MSFLPVEENPFLLFVVLVCFVGIPLFCTIILYVCFSKFLGEKDYAINQIASFVIGACFFTACLCVMWHFAKKWSLESIKDNPANAEVFETQSETAPHSEIFLQKAR